MIDAHFDDLAKLTCTRRAAALLGRPRASHYRRAQGPVLGPPEPRPAPVNALTGPERAEVLGVLRSEENCDLAPAQVWARLLDDGTYLCSISTMYRLLRAAGESRERR
ncbi:MAG: IS3-like element IS1141 family transposase, partial [Iamia sp.]